MSDDFDDFSDYERENTPQPRDHKVDEAKALLLDRFFPDGAEVVYYGRQLEIALEAQFFHWITKKALNELVHERAINFKVEQLDHHVAHFYIPRRYRYPRRQINQTIRLIAEFSDPVFTRALGNQGEMLTDSGFARIGFRIRQSKVKEVDGMGWTETNHDLDRLIERDGLRYGVEIKNQLAYIDQTEFQIKLRMNKHFGTRPMFVARMMPKNYIQEVYRAGGFCLLFSTQHYPLMSDDLAKRVRDQLGLPVALISELPETALHRFEAWHDSQVAKLLKNPKSV